VSQPVHLNDGSEFPLSPLPSADVGGRANGTPVYSANQQQGSLLDSAPCSPSLDLCDSKLLLVRQRPGAQARKLESIYGSRTSTHRMFSSLEELAELISEIGPYVSGLSVAEPVTASRLRYYLDSRIRQKSYRQFHIPKKSGGTRTITAPDGELKDILLTLAFILSELYVPTAEAMAFIRGRSIVDNARQHLDRNYVLNLDLKDFFTSITANMVENSLMRIGIPPLVAKDMSTLCTYPSVENHHIKNVLPQGAPTSPILSNICTMTLDSRLSGLARRFHLAYTRYADDITFSSNHNVYQPDGAFLQELHRIIDECHFTINPRKTRLQKRGTQQEVTGLTVCSKPNVSRRYIKNLRAQIHKIKHTEAPTSHEINVARGKLNYLRMVKGATDPTYLACLKRLNIAVKGKHFG